MTNNFRNILDLFLYAKEQNMCTALFCSTCGAMLYRSLCKEIGKDRIKYLIEAVTDEDFKHMPLDIKYDGWYEPLRLMLYDGFSANPDCPMMKWYDDGEEVHCATQKKKLILDMGVHKIYGVIGSIFKNTECEVTALFQYVGYASLPIEMNRFLEKYQIPSVHGNVRAVYYAKTSQTNGKVKEVEKIIDEALQILSSKGYRSVAMNGVKTLGHSELDNLNIIERWFKQNPQSSIQTLHLIDKRGGFNVL
ncbi:MAG: hypothetical protein IKU78_04240 [Paludibacteraceae bacterium]|nr:hypothetical protein [Paludibacteraceae bacterium]